LRVLVLEPPEALSEGAFDLAFNRVHFVAGNPLLPLKLRISQGPRPGERRGCRNAFPFLQLEVPRTTHLSLSIGSTVTSEIIRPAGGSIVALNLHHLAICVRPWSLKLLHGKLGRRTKNKNEKTKGVLLSLQISTFSLFYWNTNIMKIWGTVVAWGPTTTIRGSVYGGSVLLSTFL